MLPYAAWLASQRLPPPRPDGSTPLSVVRAVAKDARVLRLAGIWTLSAALEAPFFGFLLANLDESGRASAAAATVLVVAVIGGGMATYAALAVVHRPFSARWQLVGSSAALALTTVVMVATPWIPVIGLAGVGFGVSTALLWVTLQATTYRLRPGQVGTTQAVISGLSTVSVTIPPVVGVVADRLGLGAAMWLFVLAPLGILLLALTSRGRSEGEGCDSVRA
jgi:hypothetical protein